MIRPMMLLNASRYKKNGLNQVYSKPGYLTWLNSYR